MCGGGGGVMSCFLHCLHPAVALTFPLFMDIYKRLCSVNVKEVTEIFEIGVTELFCVLHEVLMLKHRPVSHKTLLTMTLDRVNAPDPLVPKHRPIHNIHDFSLCSVNVLYRFPSYKI